MTVEQLSALKAQLEQSRVDYNTSIVKVREAEKALDSASSPAAEKAVLQAEDGVRTAKVRVESDQRKVNAAEAQLQADTRDANAAELASLLAQLEAFEFGDDGVTEQVALLKRFISVQADRQAFATRKLALMTQIRNLQMQLGHNNPLVIQSHDLSAVPNYQPIANALSEMRPTSGVEMLTLVALANLQIGNFQPKPRKDL